MAMLSQPGPLAMHPIYRSTQLSWRWTSIALLSRSLLFVVWQALFALIALTLGSATPWSSAAAWWLITGALSSVCGLLLLNWLLRREGQRLRQLYRFERQGWRSDLLLGLGVLLLAGPFSVLPMYAAGNWLFGDVALAQAMLLQPLPLWAAVLSLLSFPLLFALTELPTYFGYVMPRLEALTGKPWLAVLLPVLFLAAQHSVLPLLFDWRFALWRFVMFVPLALLLGLALRWRPRLLPYLMVGHGLLDTLTAAVLFTL